MEIISHFWPFFFLRGGCEAEEDFNQCFLIIIEPHQRCAPSARLFIIIRQARALLSPHNILLSLHNKSFV